MAKIPTLWNVLLEDNDGKNGAEVKLFCSLKIYLMFNFCTSIFKKYFKNKGQIILLHGWSVCSQFTNHFQDKHSKHAKDDLKHNERKKDGFLHMHNESSLNKWIFVADLK